MISIVFFGSFQHYSTTVLEALTQPGRVKVVAVVTTPPRPAGRKKLLTKTHTHLWAEQYGLPVFTPEKLNQSSLKVLKSSILNRKSVDYFVVAGYGQILPPSWLKHPTIAPLNLHFSLLPKYRGANPAEWALLMGETETGVTLIKMEKDIDTGPILAQEKLLIEQPTFQGDTLKGGDTRETLYEKLYSLAAELVTKYLTSSNVSRKPFPERNSLDVLGKRQPKRSPTPYAHRLTRPDGFISWPLIQIAIQGQNIPPKDRPGIFTHTKDPWPQALERSVRALADFPGIWTKVTITKGEKRLKLLSGHLEEDKTHPSSRAQLYVIDQVQLEGKSSSTFNQIKNQLLENR